MDLWLADEDRFGAAPTWAESGAMALTGDADGPVFDAVGPLAARLHTAAGAVAELASRRGHPLSVAGCALLGERAAIGGLGRQGARSVGGLAEMVPTADGWLAVNLARPSDIDLLPALVQRSVQGWPDVKAAISTRGNADLVARAADLGLPLAAVPDRPPSVTGPVSVTEGPDIAPSARPLVVELAGLWAGPLCGDLLGRAGARVVKVETRRRPDGARRGNTAFFDLLNAGKESVVVDRDDEGDVGLLLALLHRADVVIDGSRPRVMRQWGIDVGGYVAAGTVWVSITGYGRVGAAGQRVAFGDDGAVAGGLVIPGSPPRFVADAAADPIAGLYAALAALACLDQGRAGLVSASLCDAAAHVAAGTMWREADPGAAAPPRSRPDRGRARALGADTEAIRSELGPV